MSSNIRKKILSGNPSIGTWMQIPSNSVAEILGNAGYDWVAVDLEHGHFSNKDLPDIFRAIELGGSTPFARVAEGNKKEIKAALDAGAQGIILPMIESREQLEDCISHIFYPPIGNRGIGFSRANLFGKNFLPYFDNVSSETYVVAQIENIKAVDNLDEILSVNKLDAIMIGPYDLSGSMDMVGEFGNPEFIKTIESISKKANQMNIPVGLHVVKPDINELNAKIHDGYKFIAYGVDSVFLVNSCEKPSFNI
ncbi:MAG: aldolase/citrate lyase family protein [Pseudomonadota bacterium]